MAVTPHGSIGEIGDQIRPCILSHALTSFRRMLSGQGVDRGSDFVRVVTGAAHPFGNFVCMADGLDSSRMKSAIEPLLRCGAPSAVMVCGPVGSDSADELRANGFELDGGIIAHAFDIDTMTATALSAGYRFARAESTRERDQWADAFARGYGLPMQAAAPWAAAVGESNRPDDSLQFFWIFKDEQPVCTSALALSDGVAGIYAVSTLPSERRKGLGAFATAQPLRLARALGYRVGVLQATRDGAPVYQRLGFKEFGEIPLFVRMQG